MNYVGGPLLVLAGAGSGKTSVITRKIAHLVQNCGIRAQHIVAMTFTNKAAREMKERVGTLLKGSEARGLTVSTFHNLGMNIIRKEYARLGYKPGFSIFDDGDIKALLSDIMQKEYAGDDGADEVKNLIDSWKNDLILPDEALAKARGPKEQTAAIVYLHYQRTLKAYNAVDFNDLILLPVKLFQEHADILEKWQNRIRYLLVDEYQDTNASQYLLVKMLVGMRNQFTVVGDDDQSIYAWRGARPENLMLLKQDYPSLKVVMLEQNYRSTSRILKCANILIANNPHVFEKQLWSEMGHGDEIRVIRTRNEDAECERVALEILTEHLRTERPYSDFAILYRGNYQAKLMELKLQHHQIPYRLSGGTSFFARQEVKDLMSYFRLLVNPDDDNAFLRVINVPRREIGSATLEKLGKLSTVFKEDGVVTAGNSSPLTDGAAVVIVTSRAYAEEHGLQILASISGAGQVAGPDTSLHSQPSNAIKAALSKAGWTTEELDFIEINEAFGAVAVQSLRDLDYPHEKTNIHGGAIALGHPVGATGAILMVKAIHELERTGGRTALITMCIGGGQGIAAVFERL